MSKNNYEGFSGWVKYVRDYKENIENDSIYEGTIKALQDEKERLTKKVNEEMLNKKFIEQEKDNLISRLNTRIDVLGNNLTKSNKRNDELRNTIAILYEQNEDLEAKLNETEKARRKTAGKVGGLKATITKLEKEMERKEQKIHWLKTNQKAPTKEEIIAYETRMREVEKRNKHGRTNNNI